MYATLSRVSFWGIPFTQYPILFHHCRQAPLKKGNSHMDSSVHDNPAAPSPCQYTLQALLNSVQGWYTNTNFTQHFLNRLDSSRACPFSLQYQAASSQARLKSCWAPYLLECTVACIREPGSGAMVQQWTIQTGTLVSQGAVAITA